MKVRARLRDAAEKAQFQLELWWEQLRRRAARVGRFCWEPLIRSTLVLIVGMLVAATIRGLNGSDDYGAPWVAGVVYGAALSWYFTFRWYNAERCSL